MAGRKILGRLALVSVIVSIQPATAQTTIEVSPPVTIEINPGPKVQFAPMPYGLRSSDIGRGVSTNGKHELNVSMCRMSAMGPDFQIGSPQYQVFMQQCVAEMERKY